MQRPHVVPTLALLLALGPLAGCGSGHESSAGPPAGEHVSAADQACRDRWHELDTTASAQAARGGMVRRAFASRWESVRAGISYYESTATEKQCGQPLTDQKQAVEAEAALVAKVLPYDMEHRLQQARDGRRAYAAAHPKVTETAAVRRAYRTLKVRFVAADKGIAPAVTELASTDPDRTKPIARGMKDLDLLASTSSAWTACKQALRTIYAFQHARRKH
jgi:hypothetical protein